MLEGLKEKAAGIDRKRIYTAAAALLVAGAAGHFMQRNANQGPAMMSASVPAPAPVTTTTMEPAPEQTAEVVQPAAEEPEVAPMPAEPEIAQVEPDAMPDIIETPEPTVEPAAEVLAEAPMPEAAPETDMPEVTRGVSDQLIGLGAPAPAPAPTIADETELVVAAVTDPIDMPMPKVAAPAEPEIAGCAIDVSAQAQPGALLTISISAPCNSGETVAFEHAGLRFSELLGPDGSLVIDVPAMTGDAIVQVDFEDGSEKMLRTPVPDFSDYDRIALIWQGATGLQLHALEGGASYGEPGHVWADTPATPDAATSGQGGFISVLGSTVSGYAADVYTYPAKLMDQGREPDISIEAQVMENTCGGEIDGWILRSNPNKAPNVEPLRMIVPGCDAVGEYLVLKNLPIDLKLARR